MVLTVSSSSSVMALGTSICIRPPEDGSRRLRALALRFSVTSSNAYFLTAVGSGPERGRRRRRVLARRPRDSLRRVDLIEHAAVGEVLLLRLRPAAKVGDRHELDLRELRRVFCRDLLVDRTVEVP